ncbi:MAG: hypothetical protein M3Q00_12040 [Pseudomonadota bacterium]|nr:hypothetical protein [Pseudomonadota bacterium]
MNGLRFILMLLLAIKLVSANEQLSETVADVLELKGSGGTAGEPRRHEIQVGSKLFSDKLVMLDRGAVLVVRYTTDQSVYEFRGPSLIVMYRDGPLVVEGEAAIKRTGD